MDLRRPVSPKARGGERGGSASPPGFGSPSALALNDVDSTVMAYAQWLSELQQQASHSRHNQRAELDVMRDSIAAQGGELAEFKRHSMTVVQHLQTQVGELRERVAELAELSGKPRAGMDYYGFAASDGGSPVRALRDQGLKPSGSAQQQIASLIAALNSVQEQTLLKFGEVDQAMNILHGNCASLQQNMQATTTHWATAQEALGQAVDKLATDISGFRKEAENDWNHLKEVRMAEAERLHRTEVQIATLQKHVQANTNKLASLGRASSPMNRATSPLRRAATPGRRIAAPAEDGAVHSSHLLQLLDEQEQARHKMGSYPRFQPT